MPVAVPASLREALAASALSALDAALGPPLAQRIPGCYEIEVEAAGEGTFTVVIDDGVVSARKGFAEDEPWLSCAVPQGGWPLLQRLLQAAVDGFPRAPTLAEAQARIRALRADDLRSLVRAVDKLRDVGLRMEIRGVGTFQMARGALDEVTRELHVELGADALDHACAGGSLEELSRAPLGGDRRLATELVAAFGPLLARFR